MLFRSISTKNTIAALGGIKITIKNNQMFFTATDLEIGIECYTPVESLEDGEIVLPARHFSELVRKLPNTKIIITYLPEITGVKIQYDDSEVVLKGWGGDEFPLIPDFEGDYAFEINPLVLKNMIKQTVFATSTDDTRPIFTGALFEIENNDFKIITTDTHRLALSSGKVNLIKGDRINVIVPGKTLHEISRITKDEEELIQVYGNSKQICFQTEDAKIISRLIDGQFPNYRQVIPNDPQTFIKIKTQNLQHTVERANLFSNEKDGTSVINLLLDNGVLQINSESDMGKVEEKISVLDEGEGMSISFNARYLLDVLKVIDTEDLSFDLTGSLSPAIVKPSNHDNFIYVLLPIRVA